MKPFALATSLALLASIASTNAGPLPTPTPDLARRGHDSSLLVRDVGYDLSERDLSEDGAELEARGSGKLKAKHRDEQAAKDAKEEKRKQKRKEKDAKNEEIRKKRKNKHMANKGKIVDSDHDDNDDGDDD